MPRATIPPLDWRAPIVDPKTGNPTPQFMRLWQQLFGNDAGTFDTVSDTTTGLDTKVPQTRLINTTAPLNGGGDLTNDLSLTHNTSGVIATTYGDATHIPQFTVNATGHVTAASSIAFSGGTVTSVSVVTANGVSGSVANPTTTPAITLTLGAITPSSVAATGTVTGSNLSGTNTGNQTITLTGDVTGSGTGSFAATLATVNSSVGSFGSSTLVPVITVNGKGLITAISTASVSSGSGTVTTSGSPASGNLTKFSGATAITNGDLSGDATTSGTLVVTLASTAVTPATYGDSTHVAQVTIDAKGRVTNASNVAISGLGGGPVFSLGLTEMIAAGQFSL